MPSQKVMWFGLDWILLRNLVQKYLILAVIMNYHDVIQKFLSNDKSEYHKRKFCQFTTTVKWFSTMLFTQITLFLSLQTAQ